MPTERKNERKNKREAGTEGGRKGGKREGKNKGRGRERKQERNVLNVELAEGQHAERKQGANMFEDLQAGKSRLASFKKKITHSAWFQKMGAG